MALFRRENIAVPDEKKGQIVYKWPDVNIRRFTKAIVAPDEVAVFMYQGQVLGTLPPGRHQVDATEIPFLGIFKDMLTGGNAYRVELYFVSTREFVSQRFGGRVDDVQDPQTGLVVGLRVFGEYSLQVVDPQSVILRLTGTVDATDNTKVTDWVAEQLLKVMRTDVTTNIVRNGWPILGLSAYAPDIEKSITAAGNYQLQTYGLALVRMGNFTISLSDEDEATLKGLAKDTAYSRLAGSYNQYAAGAMQIGAGEGMAQGGAATGGAFLAAGLGLGGAAAAPAQPGAAPPPAPGFAGGGGGFAGQGGQPQQPQQSGYQQDAQATVACPHCGTGNPSGSKFCASCGTSLAPPTVACPKCQTPNPQGSKFCASCGTSLVPAAEHCVKCNEELSPGAKFCPSCGQPTAAAAASTAANPPGDGAGAGSGA